MWFYYGFKRRYYLSNRKLSSVGQKLPLRWKIDLENLQKRLAYLQVPHYESHTFTDGDFMQEFVPGIEDGDVWNFDHVPIWRECVGNYSWGPKDSDRRNARTGGKEKDRNTVVLGMSKTGKKLIPFIIFKGTCKKLTLTF